MRLIGLALLPLSVPAVLNASELVSKPNIIFILADDLGYTDVACYGSKYYETPNIDRLAAEGVRFTDGYTCGPNCQPTRAALMSGQYGPRTGVYTVGSIDRFDWQSRPLRPVDNVDSSCRSTKITIAESLKKAGYATGMFGKWHLGERRGAPSRRARLRRSDRLAWASTSTSRQPADRVSDRAIPRRLPHRSAVDFIERHQDEPFFLYLPHFGVHAPHEAKEELIEKFKDKPAAGGHHDPTYAAMIASVDESVGRVMADARRTAARREHARDLLQRQRRRRRLRARRARARRATSPTTRRCRAARACSTKAAFACPTSSAGRETSSRADGCDVRSTPSISTRRCWNSPAAHRRADYPLDGDSYASLLTEPASELERDAALLALPRLSRRGRRPWRTTPVGVIRAGDWKLLEFFEDGHLELYNLRDDMGETNNLAAKMPDQAKQLHEKLLACAKEIKAPMPTPNTDIRKPAPAAPKAGKKGKGGGAKKKGLGDRGLRRVAGRLACLPQALLLQSLEQAGLLRVAQAKLAEPSGESFSTSRPGRDAPAS